MHLLLRSSFAACLLPFAGQAGTLETHKIKPDKELLITDVGVVDSPLASYPGPLSFGHLIVKMAGKNDPSEFLKRWLACWENDGIVNSYTIPARKSIRDLLIDPWKEKDGFAGKPDDEWVINFENAPFRLLAILNRTDLGNLPDPPSRPPRIPAYYRNFARDSLAGEGRFVFAALDPVGNPLPGDFTIIFEYRLKGAASFEDQSGVEDIVRWARDWHALGEHENFDADYLKDLIAITERFTSGHLPPLESRRESIGRNERSTSSAIRQVRTSEASFNPEREFREFGLGAKGFLKPKTLAATPATRFELFRVRTVESDALSELINENNRAIKSQSFRFPAKVTLSTGEEAPFLAARALIPEGGGDSFHWDARFVRDSEARRVLSFNTCNGCHAAETGTSSCLHIHPRPAGQPARLSNFLQIDNSISVPNPALRTHKVRFSEMARRVKLMKELLNPNLPDKRLQQLKSEPIRLAINLKGN